MIALYDWAFLSGYRLTCSDYTIALVGALSGAALVVKKRGVAARNSYLQQEVPSEDIEKTGAGEGNRTLIGQFLAEACMCSPAILASPRASRPTWQISTVHHGARIL